MYLCASQVLQELQARASPDQLLTLERTQTGCAAARSLSFHFIFSLLLFSLTTNTHTQIQNRSCPFSERDSLRHENEMLKLKVKSLKERLHNAKSIFDLVLCSHSKSLSLPLLSLSLSPSCSPALTPTHEISQSINEQITEQIFIVYVFGGLVELMRVILRHFSGTIQALEGTLCSCSD